MQYNQIFNYPSIWKAAQYSCFQINQQSTLDTLKKSYIGSFDSIDELIADKILDPLCAKLFDGLSIDESAPNNVSFHLDRHLIPIHGNFFYFKDTEHRCIHVFSLNN